MVIEVAINEELSDISGKSGLVAELIVDRKICERMFFGRDASPLQISKALNEIGCFIKYEEDMGLSEKDRNYIGDLYIYRVFLYCSRAWGIGRNLMR